MAEAPHERLAVLYSSQSISLALEPILSHILDRRLAAVRLTFPHRDYGVKGKVPTR